jgi:hypothetical protein
LKLLEALLIGGISSRGQVAEFLNLVTRPFDSSIVGLEIPPVAGEDISVCPALCVL